MKQTHPQHQYCDNRWMIFTKDKKRRWNACRKCYMCLLWKRRQKADQFWSS